jgi:hypothetical protein
VTLKNAKGKVTWTDARGEDNMYDGVGEGDMYDCVGEGDMDRCQGLGNMHALPLAPRPAAPSQSKTLNLVSFCSLARCPLTLLN